VKNLLPLLYLLLSISASAAEPAQKTDCPQRKIVAERLPDLNIPRCGHSLYIADGQPTVTGGHTSGFVLTPTIEYFSEGQWHVVPTVYPHDAGGSVLLKSGKILLFGSHEKNLGIGQTFEVEMYDPTNHTCDGFGCLYRKRVMPSAIEMDSGKVIVAGNWYNDDGIEMYNGESQFTFVKEVAQQRAHPYLLPISGGDVLIFGDHDIHGNTITSPLVDRLRGDAFSVPLFEQWRPHSLDVISPHAAECQIAPNTYLFPITNRQTGEVSIAQVNDTIFSFFPTTTPIPVKTQWDSISYRTPIFTDQQTKRAYLAGVDKGLRLCILSIEYDKSPAPLTLYYTDPIPHLGLNQMVLTPSGNLLIAGGVNGIDNNNFSPSNQVWLVPLGDKEEYHTAATTTFPWWAFVVGCLVVLGGFLWLHRRKLRIIVTHPRQTDEEDEKLMQQLRLLMENEKPYLKSDFRVTDAARLLNVNRSRLSACINAKTGDTFNQYINSFRVEYAKQLLISQPGIKMATVCAESGFNNETSFFRAFKAHTGKTPREWIANE
jgi:AraC-like DNA-binding protein